MSSERKKDKYRFNPESLKYESVNSTVWERVKQIAIFVAYSFIIALVYYSAYSIFFDTPMERAKKRENKVLEEELDKLHDRYSQLDKVVGDITKRDSNIYRAIFEANPINVASLNDKQIDPKAYELIKSMDNNELAFGTGTIAYNLKKKVTIQKDKINELISLMSSKTDSLRFIPSIQPVENKTLQAARASIGKKINPFYKKAHTHTGMDFSVPVGANVYATADGVVNTIRYTSSAGNRIVIDHKNTYETRYLYLGDIKVKKGETVKRGQVIAQIGNIGMAVPHLHYEVRKDGKIADPLNYFFMELSPKEYEQIMALSLNDGQSLD